MIVLKELSKRTNTVTLELTADDVCELHNLTAEAAKKDPKRYDGLDLTLTNIYEMLHHGFITDFGTYRNADYFRRHDCFANWEGDEKNVGKSDETPANVR